MIRSALRLLWPTSDPTPSPHQRAAELSTAYAVATFLNAGHAPALSLGRGIGRTACRGTRTWRMLEVQRASFAGRSAAAATALAAVRRTLTVEIGSADRRDVAHLRMLEAFAAGLEALREAEAGDATLDEAARDSIAAQARAAADALPDEPYLRYLHARTLDRLGRTDDAATVLQSFTGAAWLDGWQQNFVQFHDHLRSAAGRLPRGTAVTRLRAMSVQPGWLELAGTDLPDLLAAEAGDVPFGAGDPAGFVVHVCAAEMSEDLAHALIGTAKDAATAATIGALRSVIRERFDVVLPSVNLRTAALAAGEAIVSVDGAVVATARDSLDVASVERWWPGVVGAAPALRALLVATLRQLARLAPASIPASREIAEAHAMLLADRLPTAGFTDEQAREPVLAVTALRLARPAVEPLWGSDSGHLATLLDAGTEDALQAAVVAAHGLAVPAEVFNRLATALRTRTAADPRPFALVVRDPLLRPLLRLLLQDDFPELPVLALAELDFSDAREWFPLAASPAGGVGTP